MIGQLGFALNLYIALKLAGIAERQGQPGHR
jgi:hypothetical protein